MSDSLWPHELYSLWNSPGQNIGVSSHFLLQGIFLTQELNLCLSHCRRILYIWATREALKNIKSNKGKQQITFKGTPFRLSAHFLNRNSISQKGMAWYIKSGERKEPTTKNTLWSKTLLQIWWRNQKLSRQAKVKRIQHHQTSFRTNVKGTSPGRKQEEETHL